MRFKGAVVKKQGVTFAIVFVKEQVVDSQIQSQEAMEFLLSAFPDMPIVLMAQDSGGRPRYRGHRNIVNFLASIHPSQIPWREYTIS
ncbi:MAG: hypothetical protein ABIJ61_11055 [bacterium]